VADIYILEKIKKTIFIFLNILSLFIIKSPNTVEKLKIFLINGDWGLGQSPIPNPQSPIPNPQSP